MSGRGLRAACFALVFAGATFAQGDRYEIGLRLRVPLRVQIWPRLS